VKITPEQAEAWAKGTPETWANESLRVAVENVYKNVPADGDPPKRDQLYLDRAGPVMDKQLKKPGVRLAMVLNRMVPGPSR
jgi:S1/P1 Nuclease